MLPPTRASKPASRSIAPRAAVVVDLPFVPVTAATRPSRWRKASSISAITGTPAARAAASSGSSHGTPGETTTIEAPVNVSRRCGPELEPDTLLAQGERLRREVGLALRVGRDDPRPLPGEERRGGDPRPREPDHHDLSPLHSPKPLTAASAS